MYHRHPTEHSRQPRPFDYERSAHAAYPERLPLRPDERIHHHHPHPPHHHHSHHHPPSHPPPDSRRHPYHSSSTRPTPALASAAPDHRFHPAHADRFSRSSQAPGAASVRPSDRRTEYAERSLQARQPPAQLPAAGDSPEESRRSHDMDSRSHAKPYDDGLREPTMAANNNNHNTSSSSVATTTLSSNSHNIHRRADDYRSARYNPYPAPSGPRADSHLSPSMGRISNGASGYHSSSGAPAYDDRLPASRSHEHVPTRTYDPNSQFNHGPPKDKSPPSQSVIFMGLPIHTDEANLRAFLEECGASVDSVTIIYDRITGQSKRYGFARFVSVDHARAFVEPAFPMVTWKEPTGSRFDRSGDGLKVKIDYSQKEKVPFEVRQREREVLTRSTPATPFISELPNQCAYSHHSSSESSLSVAVNDGARDIGGTPTSILLLRGLDSQSTEQEISQHLQHIPDPSQTVLPESIRKVMLIKDRVTRQSWGYAFVQFAEVQVAVKALSLLLNTSLFPRGFQIRSRTITVTFAHEHSFHPIYAPSEWSFRGASGQELTYWDDKAYAALYISPLAAEANRASMSSKIKTLSPSKQAEESRNNGNEDTDVNELISTVDTEPQVNTSQKEMSHDQEFSYKHQSKPQAMMIREADSGEAQSQNSEERNTDPQKTEQKAQANLVTPGEGGSHQSEIMNSKPKGTESKNEKKKNGAEPIATKKMVANIAKWQSKHQEIASSGTSEAETTTVPPESIAVDEDDFSDFTRLTCVLCQRQFKSPEDLQRHNNLSNLHKTNLQNDKLKKVARAKKAANLAKKANAAAPSIGGGTTTTTTTATATATATAEKSVKYTDRAAARREAYGQPDAPNADKHEAKKARYEPAPPPALPPAQPDKDGIQATNVGSKMLEKMGWQKGEGLGNGNGRVDPVLAAQYSKGVGLGASTGVAVGQYEDSKRGFLDQVKDKTVQRFNEDST
ncbi:hypothetical protein PCANC_11638 [Puccinia coronata f. sp. avenae]|uniref:G-patch domain-containing protein n=1 Tax=Puccinia coronata f. sp. avenae TaxID=200324 RepID=A0A2N5SVJ1_9BASI|nr:hypothetical protein PCANC_11638 [Puccinia coronata f. sp. avenae]